MIIPLTTWLAGDDEVELMEVEVVKVEEVELVDVV